MTKQKTRHSEQRTSVGIPQKEQDYHDASHLIMTGKKIS